MDRNAVVQSDTSLQPSGSTVAVPDFTRTVSVFLVILAGLYFFPFAAGGGGV